MGWGVPWRMDRKASELGGLQRSSARAARAARVGCGACLGVSSVGNQEQRLGVRVRALGETAWKRSGRVEAVDACL